MLRVFEYFQIAGLRSRFRRFVSSREKVIDGIKTLAWVIPLTLLIWVYAEREQVITPSSPNVTNVPVQITSTDSSRYVEYAGNGQPSVNLQLTGPQQAFERVKEQLMMKGLKIDLGSSMGIGQGKSVDVISSIQNLDIFKSNGVTVQVAVPPELAVNIDKMGRSVVPITVPPTVTNLSPETRFEPATVAVSGPKVLLDDVKFVYAKLDGYEKLKQPGSHAIPDVPLILAAPQDKLQISPDQVTADIVVLANDVQYLIPYAVPIYVQTPETTLKSYDLALTNGGDSIANVHVVGSQQGIDAIKNSSFLVKAVLDVEPTDSGKDMSKPLRYVLPDGVKVDPADAARTVDFRLTRRD